MSMSTGMFYFVSDLHGRERRYSRLFEAIRDERPRAVFIGGDLFPASIRGGTDGNRVSHAFLEEYLIPEISSVRRTADSPTEFFVIPGNDDPRVYEELFLTAAREGVWNYIHNRRVQWNSTHVFGYAYVPPSPFRLKDWERYDVSRYVPPGCVAPEDGIHTTDVPEYDVLHRTIADDLADVTGEVSCGNDIWLMHTPPYETALDRIDTRGRSIDHVPLDTHVGSIAVRRAIEKKQPLVTLHGHIHESSRLSGSWQERIGRTCCFTAAYDGPELALVRFTVDDIASAERELL